MKRRAFISVYDKVGLIDFAKNLVEKLIMKLLQVAILMIF